jgi:hypothetical protein
MRTKLSVVAGFLLVGAGVAAASECNEQIRLLDDRYSLAIAGSGDAVPAGPTVPDQLAASGSAGGAPTSTGMDTTPNTGGLANPRHIPVEPLDASRRDRVRVALQAAKRADDSGDGVTCAKELAEARRLIQGTGSEPRAR